MKDTSLNTITATVPPTSRLVLLACAGSVTPLSIGDLAEITGATPGTLEKTVRKLRKRGYLAQTSTGFQHVYALAPHITNR
jgi:DNA-binding IscR family transcriptional regulator